MKKGSYGIAGEEILHSPLLAKLGEIAARFVGIKLVAVFPQKDRWEYVPLGSVVGPRTFCQLVQGTDEGNKKCRMCHAFMSVAASREGLAVRRCHAGLSTVVAPVSQLSETGLAVLSTCMFTAGNRAASWQEASKSAQKLGLPPQAAREAFDALPELNSEKLELAQALVTAATMAVAEVRSRRQLEERLENLKVGQKSALPMHTLLQHELKTGFAGARERRTRRKGRSQSEKCPALIEVVANLVTHKPNLPYTVTSIATAARITPNHFSALFHRWMGQSFLDFLNAKRIAASQDLLRDLSFSIGEVAHGVGYDDSNYFARRFKKATGKTPREWRDSH